MGALPLIQEKVLLNLKETFQQGSLTGEINAHRTKNLRGGGGEGFDSFLEYICQPLIPMNQANS